jgi:pyrimidine-nucleoside phosphorylase
MRSAVFRISSVVEIKNNAGGVGKMRAVDIILKKRHGKPLSEEEIRFFVKGFVEGSIPDYQASALLMAVCFTGMTGGETAYLTSAMVDSGEKVDLSRIEGVKADKHSTGGVGDTTTLITAPLAAACGLRVAKMSGRGLGHTGGTLDKLESIPGFKTDLSMDEFVESVRTVGLSVIGQSKNLVPADKLLYEIRDVTGTVDSIPLIASSIMSKKIAAGSDVIVLDVKTGSGAFMESLEDAFALAKVMAGIGKTAGKKVAAVITDMNQPLGMAVGNALEVKEAVRVLKGQQGGPLKEVSLYLTANMLLAGNAASSLEEGLRLAGEALESGRGLQKLRDMISRQGGDPEVLENPGILPAAKYIIPVEAEEEGFIYSVNAREIGRSALITGVGRTRKEDRIDPAVGLVMKKRTGDRVEKGEIIAEFHVNNLKVFEEASRVFRNAVKISKEEPELRPLVLGTVTDEK